MAKKAATAKSTPLPRPPPSVDERKAIDQAVLDVSHRPPRFCVEISQKADNSVDVFQGNHNDHNGWLTRLENVFGSRGQSFAISQLNQLIGLCQDSEKKISATALNGLLTIIEAAKPRNELEASLAVQMAMCHYLATQAIRRAARVDQIPQFDSAGNMAVKLARTFTMQAEALAKMQRGGEQIVKVVHVHAGGQAVIGNVNAGANGAPGEGGSFEIERRPHAKGNLPAPAASPMQEVRCRDEEREAVPLAGSRG